MNNYLLSFPEWSQIRLNICEYEHKSEDYRCCADSELTGFNG